MFQLLDKAGVVGVIIGRALGSIGAISGQPQAMQSEQVMRMQGEEEMRITLPWGIIINAPQTKHGRQGIIWQKLEIPLRLHKDSLYCHRNAMCEKPPSPLSRPSHGR